MPDQRLDNLQAFLASIRRFESRTDDLAYRTLYGGDIWNGSLESHPKEQGWRGVELPPSMCLKAGLTPPCFSTAAGAYQIIYPTWMRAQAAMKLPDFSPTSQDAAAIWLIGQRSALQEVETGNFDRAIELCRAEWASMPGNFAGQSQHSVDRWRVAYIDAGGEIA
jgi:lysozyme